MGISAEKNLKVENHLFNLLHSAVESRVQKGDRSYLTSTASQVQSWA